MLRRWANIVFMLLFAAAAPAAAASPTVTAIGVASDPGGTRVTISGEGDLPYEYFVIEGRSLVIDIPGAASTVWPEEQLLDDAFVGRVRVAAQTGEKPGVRVVFDLKRPDAFTVRGDGGRIAVAFTATSAAAETGAPAAAAGANRVADVTATRIGSVYRIAARTDAPPAYRLLASEDPRRIAVAIDQALLAPAARRADDYAQLNAPFTRISVWTDPKEPASVLIAIDLRQPVPFRVFSDAAGLNIDISADAPRAAAATVPAPVAPRMQPAAGGLLQADPLEALEPAPAGSPVRYRGRKITLDFIDADIADIFRLIADVSGMNIVATEDVKGKRTVALTDVPWDQALEMILKTNVPQLVQVAESDNVIRVTTLQRVIDEQTAIDKRRLEQLKRASDEQRQTLEKAEADRRLEAENLSQLQAKARTEQQRSKGWLEKTFTISYGDTLEIAKRLEKFSSKCPDGCIFETGERSKTIFVRDFVDNVEQMLAVYAALEAPTPAIMVEARIVEVQSDYAQAIGIQWGASYAADAAHGNATSFAFPNSIGIGGTAVQGTTGSNPGSYLVNLPATGAVGGIGLSLGHVANTFSLDMNLSALEKLGRTKILSNPKVLVIQNEEANINVGSQLPVPKTDTEGNRTIDWKDVGILLKVTPSATADGRVFMKIKIEKSAAGATVKTTEGEMFSIERRGAETKVLVGDGETSVIGGIFQQTDTAGNESIPGLSKLPLIGWLFKSKSSGNIRTELMIFLTPRIVNAAANASSPGAR